MINIEQLKKRCHQHVDTFKGERVDTPAGPYFFIDNGADILAVAHLDTVLEPLMFIEYPGFVTSPVLDDRLGVYIILDILPKLGLKYDILLTTGEEMCNSTAQHFVPPRQYKWMFEFDRHGTDVVMYQYKNDETTKAVESVGAYVGLGTYTDLVDLDHLECVGFNWGCAYELEHTYSCYVDLGSCEYMIDLFVEFYRIYKDIQFKYEVGWLYYRPIRTTCMYDWNEHQDWILEECEWCGHPAYLQEIVVDDITYSLCEVCIEYQMKILKPLEDCDWCGHPEHLQKTMVEGMVAYLCEGCIAYYEEYKEMEGY